MEKKYFGTDGIRGQVGESNINAEFMLKLGWATGKVLGCKESALVLIGKDTRISGYMLESALEAGLSASGVSTKIVDVMPTPAIAYLTHSIRASAGIVISASHNLYPDNGIKFFDNNGFKLSDTLEAAIEAQIDQPMRTVKAQALGKVSRMVDAPGRYIEFCKSTFPAKLNLKSLKLVIDCANGASYHVAPCIFHELGAEVITIANQPNGYNINDRCGATDVEALQKAVVDNQADAGIALDGDGDRVIMVDAKGQVVDGDELLCILALDYADQGQRKVGVVGTVMTNLGIEQTLQRNGLEFVRAQVGDRYVLEGLLKRGWILGGESSGHIVNLDYTTTGDGVITALHILRVMQLRSKSLDELKRVMVKRPQVLINVPVLGGINIVKNPIIEQAVRDAENQLKNKGRVLLRASGTEPVVRVMVEGNDAATVRQVAQELAQVVETSVE